MMKAQAVSLCDTLLKRLDELESMLGSIPQQHHALILESTPRVRELRDVAKFETRLRLTVEQVSDLREIAERIGELLVQFPQKTL